jgi:hypothetical protein
MNTNGESDGMTQEVSSSCFAVTGLKRLREVNKLVSAVTILTCIWKIPGSNLDKDTHYLD